MMAGTTSLPRFCSGMATGKAAPRGPNYSVTAGEHGEPAEGEPHIYVRPQGGRTGIRSAQPATAAGGGELPPERMPAQDTHIGRSTPLGPMVVEVRTLRGFAALTRGYRVVRPLRGRQHRRMPVQMWHEDGDTTTACSGDGDGDDVAPAILQRNGDGEGGPKGAELLCSRG